MSDSNRITVLLASAANLTDVELAVTLQSLVSQRPGLRSALLNVWTAEDALGGPRSTQGRPVPSGAAVSAGSAFLTENFGAAAPAQTWTKLRLLDSARMLAAFYEGTIVDTDHILAIAVNDMPEVARDVFGKVLYKQLVALLDKSRLGPLPAHVHAEPPPGAASLPVDPDVEPLFGAVETGGPLALCQALLALPDEAAATQLLEIARVFASRQAVLEEAEEEEERAATPSFHPASRPAAAIAENGVREERISAAMATTSAASQESAFCTLARRMCGQSGAKGVDTSHILAAAMVQFPDEALKAFGPGLRKQLVQLLEKSRLGPPEASCPSGDGVPVDSDAAALLAKLEASGTSELFTALEELPDASAATQLIEMAKIFASQE